MAAGAAIAVPCHKALAVVWVTNELCPSTMDLMDFYWVEIKCRKQWLLGGRVRIRPLLCTLSLWHTSHYDIHVHTHAYINTRHMDTLRLLTKSKSPKPKVLSKMCQSYLMKRVIWILYSQKCYCDNTYCPRALMYREEISLRWEKMVSCFTLYL